MAEIAADLAAALESREAFDPDTPAWDGTARVRRLEEELVEAWRSVSDDMAASDVEMEPLLGIPV